MIVDSIHLDTNAKKRVQNRLPDVIQYSVVCFRLNGDISILWNHMFFAILRKTHPFIGVEFKPTAVGFLLWTEVFFKPLPL